MVFDDKNANARCFQGRPLKHKTVTPKESGNSCDPLNSGTPGGDSVFQENKSNCRPEKLRHPHLGRRQLRCQYCRSKIMNLQKTPVNLIIQSLQLGVAAVVGRPLVARALSGYTTSGSR